MRRVLIAATGTALLLTPLGVAQAQDAVVDPQVVQVKTSVACGTVTITLTNPDTGAYGFTFTTGPFDGGEPGDSGRIDVAAGATVTRTVRLAEDSFDGRGFLTLGVAYGPNTSKQPFVDLGLVETDCEPAETTPPVTTPPVEPPVVDEDEAPAEDVDEDADDAADDDLPSLPNAAPRPTIVVGGVPVTG